MITVKTKAEIARMRDAGRIAAIARATAGEYIKEGVTTAEIDRWVQEETAKRGGIAAPLGYNGFPKSVCTSVNEVVCHGIPSEDVVLKNGDTLILEEDLSSIGINDERLQFTRVIEE